MKGLYRGFCRNENGTETIVLNGEKINGAWVQGNLVEIPQTIGSRFYIINGLSYYNDKYDFGSCSVEVIEETICEAVREVTDINGKQIFEGDIIREKYSFHNFYSFDKQVKYNYDHSGFGAYHRGFEQRQISEEEVEHYEVIGTIFDEQFAEGV